MLEEQIKAEKQYLDKMVSALTAFDAFSHQNEKEKDCIYIPIEMG